MEEIRTNIRQENIEPKEVGTADAGIRTEDNPRSMPLLRRFLGTLIDKVLLVFVFGCFYVGLVHLGNYNMGKYIALLNIPTSQYEYIDETEISQYERLYDEAEKARYAAICHEEGGQDSYTLYKELEKRPVPHVGSTLELDKEITFLLIILNLVFYILCESFWASSLGKGLLLGELRDGAGFKIGVQKALVRGLYGAILMIGFYYLFHLVLGFTNGLVIVLFFIVMDLPVFFCKRSLLDICSGTKYVYAP